MDGGMLTHFQRLGRYNRWANQRLLEACTHLGDEGCKEGRPSYFGSIHNTLNHVIVCDRIWLSRIKGQDSPGLALNDVPHKTLSEVQEARAALDQELIDLVDGLTADRLSGFIRYKSSGGAVKDDPLVVILDHVFNHHTHHRGQIHGMLSGTPIAPPPLDLLYFHREG